MQNHCFQNIYLHKDQPEARRYSVSLYRHHVFMGYEIFFSCIEHVICPTFINTELAFRITDDLELHRKPS